MVYERYAYAFKSSREKGVFIILNTNDFYENKETFDEKRYRIPVSGVREKIEDYGNSIKSGEIEHILIDVNPLLEAGVISEVCLLDLAFPVRGR